MRREVGKTPQAGADLLEIADYLAQDDLETGLRFLDAAELAFELLAGMPELGTLCRFKSPQAAGLRVWPIKAFENYLIFYRPTPEGIDVIRVIHGARDLESLFSDEAEG
jgi:toxin ParE1/3/4